MHWDRIFRVNLASILCRELYGHWIVMMKRYKIFFRGLLDEWSKELNHSLNFKLTQWAFFVCKNKVLKMWLIPKHFYSLKNAGIIYSINFNMLHQMTQKTKDQLILFLSKSATPKCNSNSPRNHDGNANENVTWNISSRYLYYFAIIPIRSTCTI